MADSKITDLPILTTPLNADVLPIVDVGNDSTKKISILDLRNAVNGDLPSVSGNWNSVFTNVNSNSANWNSDYTTVNSNSANWSKVFTHVGSNSGNWIPRGSNNQLQFRSGNGFAALPGSNANPNTSSLAISNNVTVGNDLAVTNNITVANGGLQTGGGGNGIEKLGFFVLGSNSWGINRFRGDQIINWSTSTGDLYTGGTGNYGTGVDLSIRRRGANNFCFGPIDANSPVSQTTSVQSAAAGGNNIAGALWTLDGSQSTGGALGGDIRFRTSRSNPVTGSSINALTENFRIKANGAVRFFPIAADPAGSVTGDVYYNSVFNTLDLFDGTAYVPLNTSRTIDSFTALDNHPVSANFATLNTRNFDNIGVLQFAAGATIREARFISVIPDNAVLANGLLIRTQFSTITATSGSCRWGAQIKKLSSTSYAASAGIDVTVSGTANQTTMTGTITLPSIDSLAAGDAYALRIFRESSDAADTLVDSAQLLTVEVRTNI